ncbi:hypothetical protein CH366_14155 [Leptospira harrisiae]|uniref:Uncharacterized protein n=1 Tax=Leptospira harrisiae TaxID=2023189 RepID=A0A2N0AFW5_9LEPT|nr:hypothetical protein CH364_18105 [Leptospira harrisiae]PKA07533.1 hypothetical protein CH366_14155 [Leptospira harrisiae]
MHFPFWAGWDFWIDLPALLRLGGVIHPPPNTLRLPRHRKKVLHKSEFKRFFYNQFVFLIGED